MSSSGYSESKGSSFKKLRIVILLIILFFVAIDTLQTKVRTTAWVEPLWVVIYPIDGDGTSANYIQSLTEEAFHPIESFFAGEARDFDLSIATPFDIHIAPTLAERPPLPPKDRNILKTIWWSLNLRYWSWMNDSYEGPAPDIKVFVLYHKVENGKRLEHSTGLEKGMVSIVHAFASQALEKKNNVVIAHELLHTLGATDKYDLATGKPIYPDGYADADRDPLYPQSRAEIMGGFIPLSAFEAEMPGGLSRTIVGQKTAAEIGWLTGH